MTHCSHLYEHSYCAHVCIQYDVHCLMHVHISAHVMCCAILRLFLVHASLWLLACARTHIRVSVIVLPSCAIFIALHLHLVL